MTGETADIVRRVALGLVRSWRPLLVVHVLVTLAATAFLAPLGAALLRAAVAFSARPLLADQEILNLATHPLGLVVIAIAATLLLAVAALEQAAFGAIAFAQLQGWHLAGWQAIAYTVSRARDIVELAARIAVAVLWRAIPILLAGFAVAAFLLRQHDINYYLAERPPVFWLSVSIAGCAFVFASALVLRRLSSWALALVLLLFEGRSPRAALETSERHTQRRRARIVVWWALWGVFVLVVNACALLVVDLLGELIVPGIDSFGRVFAALLLLLVVAAIVAAVATTCNAAAFALLQVGMFDRWFPWMRDSVRGLGEIAINLPLSLDRRRHVLIRGAALLALAVAIAWVLVESLRVEDDVRIIAHRGAAATAPENTLAAVRVAIAARADAIEIDVQETADGEVVVVHDSDFMKLAGVGLKVWEGDLARIRRIDVGSWFAPEFASERVPTLEEVLDETRGHTDVIIELKYYGHDEALERRVVDIVEAAGMQDDVAVMSLDYGGVRKIRRLRPDWPVGVLMARGIGNIARLDVEFLAVHRAMATRRLLRAAHAAGKEVYVWTVNDPVRMSSLVSLGVDGLITDRPALARQVLDERATMNPAERLLVAAADRFDWLPARRVQMRDESP